MEGLVRRTRNAHRFDDLKLNEQECYDAQGALRAIHANMEPAIEIGSGTPAQIVDRVGALLDDGMADYVCFMFPTGDMTFEESRRTLELLITDVIPQLEPSPTGAVQPQLNIASGRNALTMYWPASTISEILRSTTRLQSR